MFCYCILYDRGNCGGRYTLTKQGIKDCSKCLLPHDPDGGYDFVLKKLSKIIAKRH